MAENLLVPRFFMHTSANEAASRAAGRPIFDEFEAVEIRFPGDKQKVSVFPAHEADPNATRESIANGGDVQTYAMVYNKQYRDFKDGNTQSLAGTPLSELPFLTEGKRRELKALNIHTAEQLASLDGTPLKQLGMGGRSLKDQAQAYLDAANGSADVTALAAEVADLRRQLQERDSMLAEANEAAAENVPEEPADEPEPEEESPFQSFDKADIKAWIKDATGDPVQGNPSHKTLVKMADEINDKLAKSADA